MWFKKFPYLSSTNFKQDKFKEIRTKIQHCQTVKSQIQRESWKQGEATHTQEISYKINSSFLIRNRGSQKGVGWQFQSAERIKLSTKSSISIISILQKMKEKLRDTQINRNWEKLSLTYLLQRKYQRTSFRLNWRDLNSSSNSQKDIKNNIKVTM